MELYFSNDRNVLLAKVTLEVHDDIGCVSVRKLATTIAVGPCAVNCVAVFARKLTYFFLQK